MSCLPHILKSSNLGKQLGLTKDTAFNTIAEIRELIDSKNLQELKPKVVDSNKKIEGEQPINKEIKEESLFNSELPKVNIWAGSKENTILSNLAVRPFTFQGDEFKSVEEYFQLQKANYLKEELYKDGNEAELEKVIKHNQKVSDEIVKNENNPFQIKQLGRKFIGLDTKAWDKAALDEMKKVLKPSFEQNPKALEALLATGKAQLTHAQDTGRWKTDFPQALMEVRQELTQEQPIVEETKDKKSYMRVASPRISAVTTISGSLQDFKKAVGLTKKEINTANQNKINKEIEKYNAKNGTSYYVKYKQLGQSTLVTYEILNKSPLDRDFNVDKLANDLNLDKKCN